MIRQICISIINFATGDIEFNIVGRAVAAINNTFLFILGHKILFNIKIVGGPNRLGGNSPTDFSSDSVDTTCPTHSKVIGISAISFKGGKGKPKEGVPRPQHALGWELKNSSPTSVSVVIVGNWFKDSGFNVDIHNTAQGLIH